MYREHAPADDLRAAVRCLWRNDVRGEVTIVPDACQDVIWVGAQLIAVGPDTRPLVQLVRAEVRGLRFARGLATPLLGVPASALRDARVPLVELWGDEARRLEDAILGGAEVAQVLEGAVRARFGRAEPDPVVAALLRMLQRDPALRIAALARTLGVGERTLHRRCTSALGYGPKLLARVLRMRAFVRDARHTPEESLAALAQRLGFTDQAHLGHEAAELYASTPARLRANV